MIALVHNRRPAAVDGLADAARRWVGAAVEAYSGGGKPDKATTVAAAGLQLAPLGPGFAARLGAAEATLRVLDARERAGAMAELLDLAEDLLDGDTDQVGGACKRLAACMAETTEVWALELPEEAPAALEPVLLALAAALADAGGGLVESDEFVYRPVGRALVVVAYPE